MKYYKVVDDLNKEVVIDTNKSNYGSILPEYENYLPFLKYVTTSSKKLNLPLDLYISMNNKLALFGDLYIEELASNNYGGNFPLDKLTGNTNHKNKFIEGFMLVEVLKGLRNLEFDLFGEGFYLWEYIYEIVRKANFLECPNRLKSFYLFEKLSDCEYYINTHKGMGFVCEVELIETKSLFKGDMNLLDNIQNHNTFTQVEKIVEDYWSGKSSSKPVIEIIFQGKCKLKPLYRLIKNGDKLIKIN